MKRVSIFFVIITGISLLILLIFSPTVTAIGRYYTPPEEAALYSKYIIVGRMLDIERDLVRFDDSDSDMFGGYAGTLYTKRIGRICVEEVILAPQSKEAPEELKVYWGNNAPVVCPRFDILSERFHRGAWIIMQVQGREELILADDFFVYETELADFKAKLQQGPSVAAGVYLIKDDKFVLKIRHINFTDSPYKAILWSFEEDELRAPEPYELILQWRRRFHPEEEPKLITKSEVLNPELAESIEIESNSFVEQEIDVSNLFQRLEMDKIRIWSSLYVNGERMGGTVVSEIFADHITTSETLPDEIFGNWGTPVWWFPSEAKIRWLLLVFSVPLIIAFLICRQKGKRRTGYACLGTLLGLIWALTLLKYGPEAIFAIKTWKLHLFGTASSFPRLTALKGRPTGLCSFATFITTFFITVPFLAAICILMTRKKGKQIIADLGILWFFWVSIPLLCCLVVFLTPWSDPLM